MNHWKFLRRGRVSPFTGFRWPDVGQWVRITDADPCRDGIHACRLEQLPYWPSDELWAVDLAGTVVEGEHKVSATEARLLGPVTGWAEAAPDLASACLERTVGHAAAELRAADLESWAVMLESTPMAELPERAGDLARAAGATRRRQAETLCLYVADAAEGIPVYPVASIMYIAARAANQRRSGPDDDPYLTERRWQARWIADRLGLSPS